MTEKIKAAIIVDDKEFKLDSSVISFNSKENIDLKILQKGEGRKNFLDKARELLLKNKGKNISEEEVKSLEEELDLVINISHSQSLENALVTGLNYAEIVFIEKELCDFNFKDYQAAVEEFRSRKRNFGK